MAGMAVPSLGLATSRELKRVLSEAGWTVTRAAQEMSVSRRQIQRWLAGVPMPLDRLETLCAKSGKSVRVEIGTHEETPRPEWAEGLIADVGSIRRVVESNADQLAILRTLLEARRAGLLPAGDDLADDPSPAQTGRRRGR